MPINTRESPSINTLILITSDSGLLVKASDVKRLKFMSGEKEKILNVKPIVEDKKQENKRLQEIV